MDGCVTCNIGKLVVSDEQASHCCTHHAGDPCIAEGSMPPWSHNAFSYTAGANLVVVEPFVLWIEVLVQGVIAGAGTLYTYSKMVSLLGPSRAAVFPAMAPGLAAFVAWPILGHVPVPLEIFGVLLVMTGLIVAVTTTVASTRKA